MDDLKVDLSIAPGLVGQNTFTLKLNSNGQPVSSVKNALLRFTPHQGNIPPSEIQLIGQGNGMFAAKGTYLSLPGHWQVQAVVRRENKFDAFANFDFSVNSPGSASESSAIPREAGGALIFIGLLIALNLIYWSAKPWLRFGLGGLLTLSIAGVGLFYLIRPVAAKNGDVNPIPPNSEFGSRRKVCLCCSLRFLPRRDGQRRWSAWRGAQSPSCRSLSTCHPGCPYRCTAL